MRLGPRRRIVGEELARAEGEELFELFEVLSCGHRQPLKDGPDGLPDAGERCCKGCRDGRPPGPPGELHPDPSLSFRY